MSINLPHSGLPLLPGAPIKSGYRLMGTMGAGRLVELLIYQMVQNRGSITKIGELKILKLCQFIF
jgi:hypothetical protein